ncbi:zinc finger, CCHC-type, retrotransposon gag domain protein [Tanacetum coccineum]
MPPRRSNRVNNEADPAFTAAVAQAVADLLPTLTARITDEIHQNENNGNRRNSRRGNPGGSGNDGDAQPTDIHVWLERFQKEKPQTFSSTSTLVELENWITHVKKIFEVLGCDDQFKARLATYKLEGDAHNWWRAYKQAKGGDDYVATLSWNDFCDIFFLQYFPYSEKERILNTEFTDVAQVANAARNIEISYDRADDRRDSDRYGNHGRHGNRDRYGTDRWRGDRQGTVRHGNGSDRQGNDSQKAWHDQDQQERRITGLLVLALNVEK